MRYKLRNNADSGLWLSLLLPMCLFQFANKSHLAADKLIFVVITWLSVSQIIKHGIYIKKTSIFDPHYVFHILLSIPTSFILSWIIPYNTVDLYLIFLTAVLSYNYLISQLLLNCQGSFTLGEVQIIAQGIILFILCCLNSFIEFGTHSVYKSIYHEAVDLLMLLLLGLFLLVCFLNFIPAVRKGIQFHFICFGFAIFMMLLWSHFYKKNAFLWIFEFCLCNHKRVYLLLFWLFSTFASVVFVVWINQRPGSSTSTLDRKYFHVIINIVFIPGVIYDVQFLCFASGVILGTFIVLEIYRILDVPIIGTGIDQAFQIFLDEKDSGILILTHIYLLIGCSCPIWLSSYYVNKNEYHISLLSGIISVGFGDTFAAIGGTLFGKHVWKGTKKTLEGTACAVVAQLFCSSLFMYFGHQFSFSNTLFIIVSILLTSLLEAKTDHVDNLVLPLFMFSILSWID